jgi:Putative prokaryotic signal transducing protein
MSDNAFVSVFRSRDPIRIALIKEQLEHEGIAVATPGLTHSGMLGALNPYIEIDVQVPRKTAQRALALIESTSVEEVEPLPAELLPPELLPSEPREDAPGRPSAHRSKRAAIGFALIFPGMGHGYAAKPRIALLLAALAVGAVLLASSGVPLANLAAPCCERRRHLGRDVPLRCHADRPPESRMAKAGRSGRLLPACDGASRRRARRTRRSAVLPLETRLSARGRTRMHHQRSQPRKTHHARVHRVHCATRAVRRPDLPLRMPGQVMPRGT